MAKARMLARSISIDKELNELSLKSQLIYTWCIPFLDDFGLLTNDVGNLKFLVFPRNPQIKEKDIKTFITQETKLIEILEDCIYFKGFQKNNIITEYKKSKSEFKENGYNKGKSKYSPEIPSNPQENADEDKISKDKISKDNIRAKARKENKPMETITLDELGEPTELDNIPKKYTNKKKLYSRIAVYYMGLANQTGNVLRYFKDVKELVELAEKLYKSEDEIEAEIKARIDVVKKHQEEKELSWSLNTVIKNWNLILKWNTYAE